jgi:hypothetical protein
MRKMMLALAALASLGPIAASTGAAAAPPEYYGAHPEWRGGPYWNYVPQPGSAYSHNVQPGGAYWGTFNDVHNNPNGYHCGGGAYISCAPNW